MVAAAAAEAGSAPTAEVAAAGAAGTAAGSGLRYVSLGAHSKCSNRSEEEFVGLATL